MLFEIHAVLGEDLIQICGGGRYDSLLQAFGARSNTSAAGFAYGIERISMVVQQNNSPNIRNEKNVDVLVRPISQNENDLAINIAETLRLNGVVTVLDVKSSSLISSIRYANKKHIPIIIIIGAEERSRSEVTLKVMKYRDERRVPISEVVLQIKGLKESLNGQ